MNYLTEQNIYHAVFILLASGLFWAILWGRKWKKKAEQHKAGIEDIVSSYLHRLDITDADYRFAVQAQEDLIAFKNKQLNAKDEQIWESAKEWERMYELCRERLKENVILQGILASKVPYSRLIINNPAKLEKWLERLKGKKKTVKAKRPTPGGFQTDQIGGMEHISIVTH